MSINDNNGISEIPEEITILIVIKNTSASGVLTSDTQSNIHIFEAGSGSEALKVLKEETVQIIIADQKLPDMSGASFLSKAKDKLGFHKAILLTNYQDNDVIKESDLNINIHWYQGENIDNKKLEYIIRKSLKDYTSEKSLIRNEEKYRSAFNSMSDVFTRTDMNGICLMVSPSIYELTGYTQEEVLGRNIEFLYANPKNREKIVRKLLNSKNVKNFVIDARRKDGKIITVSTNTKIFYNSNGEPAGVEGNIRDITKRHDLEKDLKIKEAAIANSINGIGITDFEGKLIYVNKALVKMWGYDTYKEIIGRALPEFWEGDGIFQTLKELNDQGFSYGEDIGKKKDGTLFYVDYSASIIKNKKGKPEFMFGSFIDATERKESISKIKKSEENFRGIFDTMVDVYARADAEGNCLMISPSVYEVNGYTAEEIIGKNYAEFFMDPEDWRSLNKKLIETGEMRNIESRIRNKDGTSTIISSNAKVIYDEFGNPIRIESVFRDISERKRAESEHEKLFNISFDLLCIAGLDGYFKELNPAWEKATGYTLEELYSKPFAEFIHPDDIEKTNSEFRKLSVGGISFDFDNRYLTKSGKELNLSWTAIPALEDGLLYCIARDVTARKLAEKQSHEYQLRLKDLASQLTLAEEKVRKQISVDLHDYVGQMLSSIRMQMSRIIDMEDNPELVIRMKNISQALLKAIQATREAIFDLSPPQLNDIGLFAAVHDWMIEEIERKHKIKLNITGDEKEYILDEKTRLLIFRSIKELGINVIKHAKASELDIYFKNTDKFLEIIIRDNGIGFNYNADLLRLKSNSYGLFSIEERISDMGGSIEVHSIINKGTTIKLEIPIVDAKQDIQVIKPKHLI